MNKRSAGVQPRTLGSSADWSRALMEQGFDGLSRLTSDAEDVRVAHQRYEALRSHIDPVIGAVNRVEFVVAATRIDRSGRQDDAVVIVTDSMVIISGTHRAVVGARSVTDIFPRPILTVVPAMFDGCRAIELHADGRRSTLVLLSQSTTVEAALVALGGRDWR